MSNRTWCCLTCRKSYRRACTAAAVTCPQCHGACESVHAKLRVPSARRAKAWDEFWTAYREEKALLAAHERGELTEPLTLPLLRVVLHARGGAAGARDRGPAGRPMSS